jgi:hypothetical protein
MIDIEKELEQVGKKYTETLTTFNRAKELVGKTEVALVKLQGQKEILEKLVGSGTDVKRKD